MYSQANCIVAIIVCLSVCVCVSVSQFLSLATFLRYCTDSDVTLGYGRRCPLVVHCWADLQWCMGVVAMAIYMFNAKSQRGWFSLLQSDAYEHHYFI